MTAIDWTAARPCALSYETPRTVWTYDVVALSVPIIFNKFGDHDPNGMIYALERNREDINELARRWREVIRECGQEHGHENHGHGSGKGHAGDHGHDGGSHDDGCHSHCHNCDGEGHHEHHEGSTIIHCDFQPHPLIRPLVLRARVGDCVEVTLTNHIECRNVGIHLIGPKYGVQSDGSHVGNNASSLAAPCGTVTYKWECPDEGVFVFHDIGDPDGDEDGSNAHGLFGALVVEPAEAYWTDPTIGPDTRVDEGLYVDVHQRESFDGVTKLPFAGKEGSMRPPRYADPCASFREYVLIFFDEPEVRELKCNRCCKSCHEKKKCGHGHGCHMEGPCFDGLPCHCEHPTDCPGDHEPHVCDPDHFPGGSLMLFNYRSEPMKNRERQIWDRLEQGALDTTVINEEQHHSSWMFGDPATPILKAYLGDPVRIRLVHGGVKETHVFHLHLYSWHDDYRNIRSPLIDAVTITPGTAHTFVPLYGAGNIHGVPGDVIWHCHLYPHFHMGMWGMFRTFDTLQEGSPGACLESDDDVYEGRQIGRYPDGTPIEKLAVLPDRDTPTSPTPTRPGFPLFIAGNVQQKSFVPPWPHPDEAIPPTFDYRPATGLELAAMNAVPKPGELFTYFPHPAQRTLWVGDELVTRNGIPSENADTRERGVVAAHGRITFNRHDWHDPDGHFFYLADDLQVPGEHPEPKEPLFFRANAGDVLDITFSNAIGFRTPEGPDCAPDHTPIPSPTEGQLERMNFDYNIPPCDAVLVDGETRPRAECGLHVHIVKFDPICADGASTGWNYLSAPRDGMQMKYRWWADEDFGVIFFHDHLFANTRQRHGLFGALIVEREDARYLDPWNHGRRMLVGAQAVIQLPNGRLFREFCMGLGDWVAMYDCDGCPIQGPEHPSSHDDNGSMAVNYRSAPLRERGEPPELWFRTRWPEHRHDKGVTVFHTLPNEPIYIRLIQGSHEEQHSLQIHDLRWRRFSDDAGSPLRNQQTLGISEAFTFIIEESYGPGDYLWRFSGQEDTWLGCWGLIRAHERPGCLSWLFGGHAPLPIRNPPLNVTPVLPPAIARRRFRVDAVQTPITYREGTGMCRPTLIDPKGLVFIAKEMAAPGSNDYVALPAPVPLEPLILRCYRGEYVEIEITNNLPESIVAERHWPELPVESDRNQPPISTHVSMHADLVSYDVRRSDGVTAGRNPAQTIPRGETRAYVFKADIEPGPVLLQDMADIRNHRHHGLFGTLIVEPPDVVPYAVEADAASADVATAPKAWNGSRATLYNTSTGEKTEEIVLLLHDGIRYYVDGIENPEEWPKPPDVQDEHGDVDTEDQGHKAFNYRSERLDRAFCERPECDDHPKDEDDCHCHDPGTEPHGEPLPHHRRNGQLEWFTRSYGPQPFVPATPTFVVPAGSRVAVRFIGAADKPRNHGFTIHGHYWLRWTQNQGVARELVSSEGGLSTGTVRTYEFTANEEPGDYLYRSTVLKWAIAQGLWGILRVQ